MAVCLLRFVARGSATRRQPDPTATRPELVIPTCDLLHTGTGCKCHTLLVSSTTSKHGEPEVTVRKATMAQPKVCHKCDKVMSDDWNLAPIGASKDNTQRIYEEGIFLCDDCYDTWCTKWNIQPLEGE